MATLPSNMLARLVVQAECLREALQKFDHRDTGYNQARDKTSEVVRLLRKAYDIQFASEKAEDPAEHSTDKEMSTRSLGFAELPQTLAERYRSRAGTITSITEGRLRHGEYLYRINFNDGKYHLWKSTESASKQIEWSRLA